MSWSVRTQWKMLRKTPPNCLSFQTQASSYTIRARSFKNARRPHPYWALSCSKKKPSQKFARVVGNTTHRFKPHDIQCGAREKGAGYDRGRMPRRAGVGKVENELSLHQRELERQKRATHNSKWTTVENKTGEGVIAAGSMHDNEVRTVSGIQERHSTRRRNRTGRPQRKSRLTEIRHHSRRQRRRRCCAGSRRGCRGPVSKASSVGAGMWADEDKLGGRRRRRLIGRRGGGEDGHRSDFELLLLGGKARGGRKRRMTRNAWGGYFIQSVCSEIVRRGPIMPIQPQIPSINLRQIPSVTLVAGDRGLVRLKRKKRESCSRERDLNDKRRAHTLETISPRRTTVVLDDASYQIPRMLLVQCSYVGHGEANNNLQGGTEQPIAHAPYLRKNYASGEGDHHGPRRHSILPSQALLDFLSTFDNAAERIQTSTSLSIERKGTISGEGDLHGPRRLSLLLHRHYLLTIYTDLFNKLKCFPRNGGTSTTRENIIEWNGTGQGGLDLTLPLNERKYICRKPRY
ncbi:hypothetical protein B0H11DRAFT_2435867 [Mycena galericulata]|nr:hypothetical protein B0H11DRAFT_2435867 [Mycena galericulata]